MLQHIQRNNFVFTHLFHHFIRCYSSVPNDLFRSYNKILMEQNTQIKRLVFANSSTAVQILGTGAYGAPRSIVITTDHVNYIFNCGEGVQRLAQEHHFKLLKAEHILITKPDWKNIGGLPGMLLSMQETGLPEITIHGSNEIAEFIDMSKIFSKYNNLQFKFASIDESKPYENDVLSIWYVPISKIPKGSKTQSLNTNKEDLCDSNINGKRILDYTETEPDLMSAEKKLKTDTDVYSYICEIKPKRGKLSLEKCVNLGVKIGPLLRKLKLGEDIVLASGEIIHGNDVCLPSGPESTIIVVECPDEDYLESIINNTKFLKYHQTASDEENQKIFYLFHFTPEDIFNHPEYQAWLQKFPSSTQHVILNNENNCMGSEAVYKQQYLMNKIHPELFPLLSEDSLKEEKGTINNHFHRAITLQKVTIHPTVMPITGTRICPRAEDYMELLEIDDVKEALEKLKVDISKKTEEFNLVNAPEYPRIVMLGTGSSSPNKVRNTSSILVRIDQSNSILLDCAEGTVCQIIRFFGNSEAKNIFRSIKTVFLSHKHADHHVGVIGLMKEREKLTTEKLFLLLPQDIEKWLRFYDRMEPISHLYNTIYNRNLTTNYKLPYIQRDIFLKYSNIKEIRTTRVKHCKDSFGILVILNDGKKIVYSGDAMPCNNLVNLGQDCDLLIHEATMEDKLWKLAELKYHSTVSQAVNIGKAMKAKFILLTHFSQRYSKIALLSDEFDNVGIAYDNMDIKFSYLPLLPLLYPFQKLMFSEYYDEVERRTNKITDQK
ncbi:ribonuclease Z [Megalopta genalis]|uniref:ribonuclease Z n=1 Tax=Megalopta genalis TaxID=115081 RepID=UPI003FD0B701